MRARRESTRWSPGICVRKSGSRGLFWCRIGGRFGDIDGLVEDGSFLAGSLGSFLHCLNLDGPVKALDDDLGVVLDSRVGGRLERELLGAYCRVELDVRVDEPDLAGIDLLDRASRADNLAVRTHPARVLEDRGNLAEQVHPVRPAIVLAQVERGQTGHEGR